MPPVPQQLDEAPRFRRAAVPRERLQVQVAAVVAHARASAAPPKHTMTLREKGIVELRSSIGWRATAQEEIRPDFPEVSIAGSECTRATGSSRSVEPYSCAPYFGSP